MVRAQDDDRTIGPLGETLVDARGDLLEILAELAVALDDGAARGRELHERKSAANRREALEKTLHGQQPLLHAFGVIEAIDADADERVLSEIELTNHARSTLGRRWDRLEPAARPFDRNRIGTD